MRIGLMFGGRSGEHAVSLLSAASVRATLRRAGHEVLDIGVTETGRWLVGQNATLMLEATRPPDRTVSDLPMLPDRPSRAALGQVDVVFPLIHGPNGEDGSVQGLLELANVPYVGCGILGSALAMDKTMTKRILGAAGLLQVRHQVVKTHEWTQNRQWIMDLIEGELDYPLFVKPANLGSSLGVSRVRTRAELGPALDLASQYGFKLLVEAAVPNVRELEVSVLGCDEIIASVPGEIVPRGEFYDYEAKYHDPDTELCIPADVAPETVATLHSMAIESFRLLDGCGMARVDFLMDDLTGTIYLNELNTIPGFTAVSMYPKLWAASGLDYAALLERLMELAIKRHTRKQRLKTTL